MLDAETTIVVIDIKTFEILLCCTFFLAFSITGKVDLLNLPHYKGYYLNNM